MSKAKAPSRGDKITLEFGLVSVPVTLYNAVDEEAAKISRHMRTNEGGHEVGFSNVDKVTGEVISRSDTFLAYEAENGVEVELSDEEIAAAMGFDPENPTVETLGIYPMSEFSKYLVANNFQVRPQTMKAGTKTTRPFDKAFTLFMDALAAKDVFVLVTYVSRGKPKLVAVFGDGRACSLHWANEVREDAKKPDPSYSEAERDQALLLIETFTSKDPAPLPDNEPVEKVRAYANAKAAGEAPKAEPKIVHVSMDLEALLAASVEKAKAGKS